MPGLSVTQFAAPLEGVAVAFDDDSDASPSINVFKGPARILNITLKNANASTVYFKAWDKTEVVVGTTPPDIQIPVAANKTVVISLTGSGNGLKLVNGWSHATVTTAGTSGTTSPSTPIDVWITAADVVADM